MHRFLVFIGVCFWLVSLVGCGGDDSTPVASNDSASSEDEGHSEDYGEEEGYGESSEESGDSEEGYGSGSRGEYEEEMEEEEGDGYGGYGEEYEEEMEEEEEEYGDGYGGYGEEYEEEMEEEEEEYGDGYGGEYGYGEEGGYGSGRSGAAGPPKPVTLADKSLAAFAQGHDKDAFQYLFAHAVTADDVAATELLGKMGLLIPAKRPAMAVRWGIGIEYTGAKDYKAKASPIGTKQNLPTTGRSRSGGYGESGGGGYGDESGGYGDEGGYGSGGMGRGGASDAELKQLTGELGERLVDGLSQRIAAGEFGKVLAEAMSGGAGRRPGAGRSGYGGDSYYGEEDGYGGGYGEEEEDSGGGYSSGGGYGQAGRQARVADRGPKEPTQLVPGVVFLGVEDDKVLKQQAKDAELDVLCIFEVSVKLNPRLGTIINETTIAVYNVLDDVRAEHETKKMNNIQVQVARTNGDKDVVEEEMEELFEYIDSTWLMTDLPTNLTEKSILDRLRPLIIEPQANPLPILGEIRMYRTRGLLSDENYAIACKSLLGDQVATTLATGTEEEKKLVVEKWLPTGG